MMEEGVTGSRAEALQIALGCTEHLAKPIRRPRNFSRFFSVIWAKGLQEAKRHSKVNAFVSAEKESVTTRK
jgi:hypothetical protein